MLNPCKCARLQHCYVCGAKTSDSVICYLSGQKSIIGMTDGDSIWDVRGLYLWGWGGGQGIATGTGGERVRCACHVVY